MSGKRFHGHALAGFVFAFVLAACGGGNTPSGECEIDAECDDGLFCNGQETCTASGQCQAGSAPVIDDGIGCTVDTCDEATDQVVHQTDHDQCDDGLFCNGLEVCDPNADCQPGPPPEMLDDGIACTVDTCDEATGAIDHVADDTLCDDGLFCNGLETCDAVADCRAGTPPGDGIACTDDVCDEATDTVMGVPNHASCDDNLACTTMDLCDPVLDCVNIVETDPVCGTCENCGFETGDFTSWDTLDLTEPFDALRVEITGGGGGQGFFWTVQPTEGTYAAYNGFDGTGPGTIEIGQDISLHPSAPAAVLAFDYRAGWDTTFGATLPRTFEVLVEPAGGGVPMQTDVILVADPGTTTQDTGDQTNTVDLTPFIGQTVYIRFVWDVPEPNTGPAAFQLDNITITVP